MCLCTENPTQRLEAQLIWFEARFSQLVCQDRELCFSAVDETRCPDEIVVAVDRKQYHIHSMAINAMAILIDIAITKLRRTYHLSYRSYKI